MFCMDSGTPSSVGLLVTATGHPTWPIRTLESEAWAELQGSMVAAAGLS